MESQINYNRKRDPAIYKRLEWFVYIFTMGAILVSFDYGIYAFYARGAITVSILGYVIWILVSVMRKRTEKKTNFKSDMPMNGGLYTVRKPVDYFGKTDALRAELFIFISVCIIFYLYISGMLIGDMQNYSFFGGFISLASLVLFVGVILAAVNLIMGIITKILYLRKQISENNGTTTKEYSYNRIRDMLQEHYDYIMVLSGLCVGILFLDELMRYMIYGGVSFGFQLFAYPQTISAHLVYIINNLALLFCYFVFENNCDTFEVKTKNGCMKTGLYLFMLCLTIGKILLFDYLMPIRFAGSLFRLRPLVSYGMGIFLCITMALRLYVDAHRAPSEKGLSLVSGKTGGEIHEG